MQCIDHSRECIKHLLQHQRTTLVIFSNSFSLQMSLIQIFIICFLLPIMLMHLKCIEQLVQVWLCSNIWSFSLHNDTVNILSIEENSKMYITQSAQSGHIFQANSCSTFSTKPTRESLLLQRICEEHKQKWLGGRVIIKYMNGKVFSGRKLSTYTILL